ncbi:M1 family metallopeptidase [Sediminicola luteus]|uniref:Peptidase M1 n=1 Tax=Sediminicola luteus TaxID=319238 RepID=A0A2A4G3E0_9FLAO|nr:M1 family metallopeptidase [Sediminicola luteus]PCE62480.1 peptidase M1 [Sediminicola luteus]
MRKLFSALLLLSCASLFAQQTFTQQDSLRGSITPERAWWDLNYYHLDIKVDPDAQTIAGTNTIRYKVTQPYQVLQVDLQPPMKIEKITQDGKKLKFNSNINAHFVKLRKKQRVGDYNEIVVHYSGKPIIAKRPPWDGGLTWEKDGKGDHFFANSNQGIGSSVWWPNKDHPADEVDSMAISVEVPKNLMDVSNGRLRKVEEHENTKTYHWFVSNPINNYGVNINVADYAHFSEDYAGEKGNLTLDYYVLKENLEKAKKQFNQALMTIKAFEYWFGPYPFYEDGFKLVEAPYLGMEHQSSVTYGNKYQNGYMGRDLSQTGRGLLFDFLIVHESGHEWFANNITDKDVADMWIHESFTAYSENLFLDYHFGYNAACDYVLGTKALVGNKRPIIGQYNVNNRGDDIYYKGANMLHTLRHLIEDDEKWRSILRGLNKDFYHQTVTTKQIEDYISNKSGIDLTEFFEQYLRTTMIPTLEYKQDGNSVAYRYTDIVSGFDMPVQIISNNKKEWIYPTATWKTLDKPFSMEQFEVDRNFYLETKKL